MIGHRLMPAEARDEAEGGGRSIRAWRSLQTSPVITRRAFSLSLLALPRVAGLRKSIGRRRVHAAAQHPADHGRPAGRWRCRPTAIRWCARPTWTRWPPRAWCSRTPTAHPALRAVARRADDRPAAVADRRLRQRRRVRAPTLPTFAHHLRARATAPASPARCTSSAPTSCTASRSG